MTTLTHAQKLARNQLAETLMERPGARWTDVIREASSIAAAPRTAPSLARIAGGSRKAARRAIEHAAITRAVTEALTASAAPAPPSGQQRTSDTPAATAPDAAARPLHEMSADELRAYSARALQDHAEARGLGSPIWQDGGLLSLEPYRQLAEKLRCQDHCSR